MKKITEKKKKYFKNRSLKLERSRVRKRGTEKHRRNTRVVVKIRNKRIEKRKKAPFVNPEIPNNLSFVDNTNEVIKFLNTTQDIYSNELNVEYDLRNVNHLSSDAIGVLIATIKDEDIVNMCNSRGHAPDEHDARKIFLESGFDKFVTGAYGFKENKDSGILHRESHMKVKGKVATKTMLAATKHVYGEERPMDSLYETLVECMANTTNHAKPKTGEACYWWLYIYNDPVSGNSCFTFIDLGVGIFESKYVADYVTNYIKRKFTPSNIELVDDLLEGKISSRMVRDRDIRGKGLPQIVSLAQQDEYKKFYIITNNVKIDLKKKTGEELEENFSGTVLYWELGK